MGWNTGSALLGVSPSLCRRKKSECSDENSRSAETQSLNFSQGGVPASGMQSLQLCHIVPYLSGTIMLPEAFTSYLIAGTHSKWQPNLRSPLSLPMGNCS